MKPEAFNCDLCGAICLRRGENTIFGASNDYFQYLLCDDCAKVCSDFVDKASTKNNTDQPFFRGDDYPTPEVIKRAGEKAADERKIRLLKKQTHKLKSAMDYVHRKDFQRVSEAVSDLQNQFAGVEINFTEIWAEIRKLQHRLVDSGEFRG